MTLVRAPDRRIGLASALLAAVSFAASVGLGLLEALPILKLVAGLADHLPRWSFRRVEINEPL